MGLLPDLGDPSDPKARTRYAYLQGGVAIGVNLSLFLTKLLLSTLLASVAVLSDAFNQLGDVGISAMVLVAFAYAAKEADPEHPYGHGRLEQVAGLLVAAFLVFVAALLLVQSVLQLPNPSVRGTLPFALLLGVLAGVKELLARFSFAVADRLESDAIRGDAWNHRYDAMLTGAIALAIFLTSLQPAWRVLDPLFGILVAGVILYTGARLIRSSGESLLGRAPSEALVQRVSEHAGGEPGVRGVHNVSVHEYGMHRVIGLTIDVDQRLSVREAHEIASRVEAAVGRACQADCTVHVEPAKEGPA